MELDELIKNADPGFVAKNAAKLGIEPPKWVGSKICSTIMPDLKDNETYVGHITAKVVQNKYHVAPVADRMYKGVIYDSKREMLYYINTLEPKLRTGELDYVLPHICFPLGGGVKYECDFLTMKRLAGNHFGISWDLTVIEVKMWRKATAKHPAGFFFTPDAKIKMKLFREQYKELKLEIVK